MRIIITLFLIFTAASYSQFHIDKNIYGFDTENIHFKFPNTFPGKIEAEVFYENKKISDVILTDNNDYWIGKVENILRSNKDSLKIYDLKVNGSFQSSIIVYPSINESENSKVTLQHAFSAEYGKRLLLDYKPTSGLDIPLKNFKTIITRDADRDTILGTNVRRSDDIIFSSKYDSSSLKIIYINPISGSVTEVFPEQSISISQSPPDITYYYLDVNTEGNEKIVVSVSNIVIINPAFGNDSIDNPQSELEQKYMSIGNVFVDDDGNILVNENDEPVLEEEFYKMVQESKPDKIHPSIIIDIVDVDIKGYELDPRFKDVQFELSKDNRLSFKINLINTSKIKQDIIEGTIDIRIISKVTNPINNKTSEGSIRRIKIPIKHFIRN